MSTKQMKRKNTRREESTGMCGKMKDVHNSPEFYNKLGIQQIQQNFKRLTALTGGAGVLNEGVGLATLGAMTHQTIVHVPVDTDGTFMRNMHKLYEDIRERNSGAANYTANHLAAYIANMYTLHMLCEGEGRRIGIMRKNDPMYLDSPYLFANLCGVSKYQVAAAGYASDYNRYKINARIAEDLPLPTFSALERGHFLYGTLFADSDTTSRPSLVSLIPTVWFVYKPTSSGLTAEPRKATVFGTSGLEGGALAAGIEELLDIIVFDDENLNQIIRGDLANAFGNECFKFRLSELVDRDIPFGFNPFVSSQLANATMLGWNAGNVDPDLFELTIGTTGASELILPLSGVMDRSFFVNGMGDNFLVNSFDSRVKDQVLSITRMMLIASPVNGTSRSEWHVSGSSGDTIWVSALIRTSTPNGYTATDLQPRIEEIQSGNLTAGVITLLWGSRNIDSFPLIVTDPSSPTGYMCNLDNFAYISKSDMANNMLIANMSLTSIRRPRLESGQLNLKL